MQTKQLVIDSMTAIELQNFIANQFNQMYSKIILNESKPDDLISRIEAAELLRISLPTLLEWTKTGKITGYRIGSRVMYKRNEIVNSLTQIKTK